MTYGESVSRGENSVKKTRPLFFVLPCWLLAITLTTYAFHGQTNTATALTAAAEQWLTSLTPSARAQAQVEYDTPARLGWHFIPKKHRKGLPLKDMSAQQRKLAVALLRTALSQSGYEKATAIMRLESVLNAIEAQSGGGRHSRDPLRYYVTIFGTPSERGRWGLSFEGHHLSLNFVIEADRVVASTPQFLAANPAQVREDYLAEVRQGTRVLGNEETLGFDLLGSLSSDQMKKALLSPKAPRDIRHGGEPHPPQSPPQGLAAAEMTMAQRARLEQLLEAYLSAMPQDVATARRERLKAAGFENIYFAWAGASEPHIGHYYRVQGPTLLIEFVNTQPDSAGNPANHIHCVWRNPAGDFGLPAAAGD